MPRRALSRIFPALGLYALSALAVQACGTDTDCQIGDRSYRIYLPQNVAGTTAKGALVFAHGYKGSATRVMRNAPLTALADRLGVALVAVKSSGDDWSIPGAPSSGTIAGADELAYFDQVRSHITRQFDINANDIVVTGFSAGGMMVWNLACYRSTDYRGFIPIAGAFWRPVPASCNQPLADIVHIHGRSDKIVPLQGRVVQDAEQGDIDKVITMYRNLGNYGSSTHDTTGDLSCEVWQSEEGTSLRLCLHDGGHSFKITHLEAAVAMLLDKPQPAAN